MPCNKARRIPREVNITGNNSTAVPAHDLHGNACSSLQAPANIPRVPRHAQRDLRVDPDGRKHGPCILNTSFAAASQHSEPHDSDKLERHEEYTALLEAVRKPARPDRKYACAHVRWDGHELCIIGCVAHVFDDSRQKQGEGVDGTEARQAEDEAVYIDFPIAQRLVDILHVEVIGEVAMVDLETSQDFTALFGGQECCAVAICVKALIGVWGKSIGRALTWQDNRRCTSTLRCSPIYSTNLLGRRSMTMLRVRRHRSSLRCL